MARQTSTSIEGEDVVSFGYKNLDVLLSTNGIPKGNVGMFVTSPASSNFRILRSMFIENLSNTLYITTTRTIDNILHQVDQEVEGLDESPELENMSGVSVDIIIKRISEYITEQDIDLVIIDTINNIDGIENSNIISKMSSLSKEHDFVGLLHSIETNTTGSFEFNYPLLVYTTDFLFSLNKIGSQQSIRQQLKFNKLPRDSSIDESQLDMPIVEVPFIRDNLSVDSGDRI